MLKARILTALVLIPIVIAAIFLLPPVLFFSLALLLMLAVGWEWAQLAGLHRFTSKLIFLIVLAAALLLSVFVTVYWVIIMGVVWWALAGVLLLLYPKARHYWSHSQGIRTLMGVLMLIPFWIGLIILQGFSPVLLLYCLVLIWSVDSAAYFVGKQWGTHKLAPTVSPGKSYEGLLGGVVAALLVTVTGIWFLDIPATQWLLFAVICIVGGSMVSLFGDLFESMLKRESHVKESGSLLPGHGGLLDRIDSLTTAIPFFALVFPFFFSG